MRFPEFSGEWEKTSIGECFSKVENGLTYDTDNTRGVPVTRIETISDKSINYDRVGYANIDDKISKYEMQYGDVLFSHINSLKHIGKTAFYDAAQPLYHGMNLLLLRAKKSLDSKFLYYTLNTHKFLHRCQVLANQAVNQASINTKELKSINISVPQMQEQQKISGLISLLDERIKTQKKIIEDLKKLKDAIAEKLFCSPDADYPELRIIDSSEKWKQYRLKDVCQRITERNWQGSSSLVLTIAAQHGLVSQTDFFNKSVASENLSNYFLIHKGDFAYNKSYSGEYTWGAVKRLNLYEEGLLSPLYICFRPDQSVVNSDFLSHYFETHKWHNGIAQIAGEGARNHGLLNVSISDYFATLHRFPRLPEQEKIANYLNLLSNKISLASNELECYMRQKKYLLARMFI